MDEAIEDAPPSAKLVYKVLEYEGPLTQKQIAVESRLPGRTVRDALDRLSAMGLVSGSIHLPDARQRVYRLEAVREEEASVTR